MNPVRYTLIPQRVALNENFYLFYVAFHIFVAGNRRHFKFGTRIDHRKSQPTDDKPCLKWTWSRYVTHFKF